MSAIDLSDATSSDSTHNTSLSSSTEYSTAQSNPAISTHSHTGSITAESSAASRSESSFSGGRTRQSLTVLGSLPKDISSLIRSHSNSRQQHTSTPDPSIYDPPAQMAPDDDRPSRKSKSGHRFYNFIARSLTRSRSRSRSRNGRVPSIDHNEPMPDLPTPHDPAGTTRSMASKPPTRLQSRPISSTTTATNATITPATPRNKRRPPGPIALDETPKAVERPPATPSTSRASSTRRKIQNLFGIPLTSPKKSSLSSSQNSSRRQSLDVTPRATAHVNGMEADNDATPKPLKTFSPHPHSRPQSPLGGRSGQPTRNVSGSSTNTSSTSASSRLHKFFSGQKPSVPPRTDVNDVSGPLRRASTSHQHHNRRNSINTSPSPPTPPAPDLKPNGTAAPLPPPPPPRIAQATPTPPRSEHLTVPSVKSSGHSSQRRPSSDNSTRGPSIDKGKEKDTQSLAVPNGNASIHTRQSHRQSHRSSTKHGSFDFERPGWSAAGAIQRSGSGGTSGTGTSGTATTGPATVGRASGLAGIRESTMGPGLAGVGTLQRDMSMKRAKEREDMIARVKEDERKRKRATQQQAEEKNKAQGAALERHRSLQSSARGKSPEASNTGHTTISATDKTSSWGKKRGGLFRNGRQLTSIGLTHGPFSFEPAVPSSPTWSIASAPNGHDAPLVVSWGGEKGRTPKDKEQERNKASQALERGRTRDKEKEKEKEREKQKEKQDKQKRVQTTFVVGDRAPVPVPNPISVGHRSGLKGRSLDLGIGLSWAPTTVREEALLPSSALFTRSMSGGSLAGHSMQSTSTRGGTETIEEAGERSGIGREVAEVFKSALDTAGYATFKKYVHRFDAHDIPFDGPTGIVARVERLLTTAPGLNDEKRRRLLDDFVRVILQNM